jgi:hypothetical protein
VNLEDFNEQTRECIISVEPYKILKMPFANLLPASYIIISRQPNLQDELHQLSSNTTTMNNQNTNKNHAYWQNQLETQQGQYTGPAFSTAPKVILQKPQVTTTSWQRVFGIGDGETWGTSEQ